MNYYRTLGQHMNIPDIPETFEAFEELLDSYEAEHFGFDPGARRVADATLALMLTFHPRFAARAVEVFSRALMDRAAARGVPVRRAVAAGGAALPRPAPSPRGGAARCSRPAPYRRKTSQDLKWIRSYPDGFDVEQLGTFPSGCPVQHRPEAG